MRRDRGLLDYQSVVDQLWVLILRDAGTYEHISDIIGCYCKGTYPEGRDSMRRRSLACPKGACLTTKQIAQFKRDGQPEGNIWGNWSDGVRAVTD